MSNAEFRCDICTRPTTRTYVCSLCRRWVCPEHVGDTDPCRGGEVTLCLQCQWDRRSQQRKYPGSKPRCDVCFFPAAEDKDNPCSVDHCHRNLDIKRGPRGVHRGLDV